MHTDVEFSLIKVEGMISCECNREDRKIEQVGVVVYVHESLVEVSEVLFYSMRVNNSFRGFFLINKSSNVRCVFDTN